MTEPTDHELLADYARTGAETAFAQLVARHIHLVHSAALRYTDHAALAEEITQAVFLILARKAGSLAKDVVLSGWLYQTARLTAANALKADRRRQLRDHQAYMQAQENEADAAVWREIAPLLDDAMGRLNATDRTVLLLRFFERQTNAEVAIALKLKEAAVQKRVLRALEKLRVNFAKQGVTHTAQAIAGTVTQNAVQVAPAGLLLKVSALAAKGAATTTSITSLVKGTLKIMAWSKAKMTITVALAVLFACLTTIVILNELVIKIQNADKRPQTVLLRLNNAQINNAKSPMLTFDIINNGHSTISFPDSFYIQYQNNRFERLSLRRDIRLQPGEKNSIDFSKPTAAIPWRLRANYYEEDTVFDVKVRIDHSALKTYLPQSLVGVHGKDAGSDWIK